MNKMFSYTDAQNLYKHLIENNLDIDSLNITKNFNIKQNKITDFYFDRSFDLISNISIEFDKLQYYYNFKNLPTDINKYISKFLIPTITPSLYCHEQGQLQLFDITETNSKIYYNLNLKISQDALDLIKNINLRRYIEGKLPILNIKFQEINIRIISTNDVTLKISMKKTILNNELRSHLVTNNYLLYETNLKKKYNKYLIMGGLIGLTKQ